jgi:hypothetical protein
VDVVNEIPFLSHEHGMYSLKGPEDILHILDLYQKEPHTLHHKSTHFVIKYSQEIYVTPKNLAP